jgi:hypothetical protein
MKLIYALLIVSLAGCAKNSLDIVNEGKPMGVFQPKKDYVVDIPMGQSTVSGESSGVEILGFWTIGAGETAEGVDVGNRGNNTLKNSGSSSGGSSAIAGVTSTLGAVIEPASSMLQTFLKGGRSSFKAAALRDACEKNNCDVLGYTMYNVNEKNFFLFKTYDVKVKGFPGRIQGLENVNRTYSPTDSYWRTNAKNIYSNNLRISN